MRGISYPKVTRFISHFMRDIAYGSFLGGKIKSKYSHLGAYDVVNSDYLTLKTLFKDRVAISDVIVDVGCGKGRVINYLLSLNLGNKIYGIELDEEIGYTTKRRLRKYSNVTILIGNAIDLLPDDGTLLYLYNPFDHEIMKRFKKRCEDVYSMRRGITIIYYNQMHINIFQNDDRWQVDEKTFEGYGHNKAAILKLIPVHSETP
jgi:hypothetical protein